MFATRKEPAVEGKIPIARADGQDNPVTQPQIHPCPVVEWKMIGARRFEALIVGVTAQIRGAEFEVAENFVALTRIERIVTPIVPKFRDDRAYGRIGQAFGGNAGLCVSGIENLILITDTQVAGR